MKVTIIIPVYNLENYIEETLTSIILQTYSNYECIIINDGSTDESPQRIKNTIGDDNRFVLFNTKNNGVSAARNLGLNHVKGEYVLFVDGDDPLPIDSIEVLINTARKEKADIVIGKMLHNVDGVLHEIPTYREHGVYNEGIKSLGENPEILHSIGPTAKLFHKRTIEDNFFPNKLVFAEEHAFIVKAYLNSTKIFTVDHFVYQYMIRSERESSATQQIHMKTYQYMDNLITSHIQVYELLKDLNSVHLQNYYYFRITEYIMWPLLIQAIKQSNFHSYQAMLHSYFQLEAHRNSMTVKVFKKIYIDNYIKSITYDFFKANNEFIEHNVNLISLKGIQRYLLTGMPKKWKFLCAQLYYKVTFQFERIHRKWSRIIRK